MFLKCNLFILVFNHIYMFLQKRDPKKSKQEDSKDNNVTIAADTESQASFDSTSVPASPQSVVILL